MEPFIFDSVWIESKSHKLFELFSTLKSYRSIDVQSTSSKYARVRTKNAQSDATFESNKSNVSYINRWSFQFPLRVWHKPLKTFLNPNFYHRIENRQPRLCDKIRMKFRDRKIFNIIKISTFLRLCASTQIRLKNSFRKPPHPLLGFPCGLPYYISRIYNFIQIKNNLVDVNSYLCKASQDKFSRKERTELLKCYHFYRNVQCFESKNLFQSWIIN